MTSNNNNNDDDETKIIDSSRSDQLDSSPSEETANKITSTQLIDTQPQLNTEENVSSLLHQQQQPPDHVTHSYGVTIVQEQNNSHNYQPSNLASNHSYQGNQIGGRIVYLQNAAPSSYYQNLNGMYLKRKFSISNLSFLYRLS